MNLDYIPMSRGQSVFSTVLDRCPSTACLRLSRNQYKSGIVLCSVYACMYVCTDSATGPVGLQGKGQAFDTFCRDVFVPLCPQTMIWHEDELGLADGPRFWNQDMTCMYVYSTYGMYVQQYGHDAYRHDVHEAHNVKPKMVPIIKSLTRSRILSGQDGQRETLSVMSLIRR